MKILFRCIFNAALFLMLIVAMVLLLPGLFGIRPYVVYSGSMEPKIPTGAVVFTKEGAYSPETGDIITFHNEDTVVTHRVVKKEEGTFITKGDANSSEDAPVLWDNVVGKVFVGIPRVGKVFRMLTAAENRPVVITGIVALFAVPFAWDLIRGIKKGRKKTNEEVSAADSER